jgi:hypothetical protein
VKSCLKKEKVHTYSEASRNNLWLKKNENSICMEQSDSGVLGIFQERTWWDFLV